jgi:dihydrofolate reductase
MRKLIVKNIVSLDGYHEGPGGNVMALPMDHSFDAHNAERMRAADTMLLGRKTYELFEGFWPQVLENPGATPAQREIARLIAPIEKIVVSDSLGAGRTTPWSSTTRILKRGEAHAQIAELKRRAGKEIIVFGSRTLWNDLLSAGLVDELHLMVGPIVLGGGTPAFGPAQASPLRLLDTRRWDGSSNVLLRYAASGQPA